MKRFLTGLLALIACTDTSAPVRPEISVVPGRYIVTTRANPRAVAQVAGIRPGFIYEHALLGFAADLTADQVVALRAAGYRTEPDQQVHTTAGAWGIDRIDQRRLPLDSIYAPLTTGAGVVAYIIDTGIDPAHPDFGGRAVIGADFVGDGWNGYDCMGHGTHVAGTIGGTKYGVAKAVTLIGVRVLDCGGSGWFSTVIAGIDWVAANHGARSVANMSLGGPLDGATNDAVTNLVASGVFTAVAAGNNSGNACDTSPASTAAAFTTGATDDHDARAWFSNYGDCVDGFAPGWNILSDIPGGGTAYKSGTSMATPHVAGVAALILSEGNYSVAQVDSIIRARITKGIVSDARSTLNNLIYALQDDDTTSVPVVPPPPPPPNAPSNLAASVVGGDSVNAQIQLTWTDNSDNEIGFGVDARASDGTFLPFSLGANMIAFTWPFKTGVVWTFKIRAWGDGGESDWSNSASVDLTGSPPPDTTPSPPPDTTPAPPPNAAPVASFTVSCTLLICNFTDSSTDSDGVIVGRLWNFGDGVTSNATNPGHTYAAAGTYTVTLRVTDDDGATASVAQSLKVWDRCPPGWQKQGRCR